MNEAEALTIWVSRSQRVTTARFVRYGPLPFDAHGRALLHEFRREHELRRAAREGRAPELCRAATVPLALYHIAEARLLIENETLMEQGVEEGDTFLLLEGQRDELERGCLRVIRDTQAFPLQVPATVSWRSRELSVRDILELPPPRGHKGRGSLPRHSMELPSIRSPSAASPGPSNLKSFPRHQ